jgi:hypothetical protein
LPLIEKGKLIETNENNIIFKEILVKKYVEALELLTLSGGIQLSINKCTI